MTPLVAALAILLGGGLLALGASRSPRLASALGAGSTFVACALAAIVAGRALLGGPSVSLSAPWSVPGGALLLGCDGLSAFFLLPVAVLCAVAAIYGAEYLFAYRDEKRLGVPWLAWNVLVASMMLVTTARHGLVLLVAWEAMTLSSYLLVVFEHEQREVRRAGFVYLVAAHVGTACLVALFLLLESATGSLGFGSRVALGGGTGAVVLLLALVGFGVKAGLVPLHVWLPEAHAVAPSHVSATMSGVLVKMGVYGIVRTAWMLAPAPSWWGETLIVIGLVGALLGISLASYQRDLKRVLAYSTVENVGLIFLGLGLGHWGHANGHPMVALLGFWGAFFHVWNHGAMKGLLFLGAGCVVHGAGTRDLEKLGGLMKWMPAAGALFVVGAIAIAGLPPLNGFAGEWLLYRSALEGAAHGGAASGTGLTAAIGILALVGTLASLTFVRVVTVVWLGQPRSERAAHGHAPGAAMLLPMAVLGAACVFAGAWPDSVSEALRAVVQSVDGSAGAGPRLAAIASSFDSISLVAVVLWAAIVLSAGALFALARRHPKVEGPTWGCGYVAPTTRMQYTGRAFSQLSSELLPRFLRAKIHVDRPAGTFPAPGRLASTNDDPLTRGVYEPVVSRTADRFARLRWLQQGAVHLYVLYILAAVVAGLAWVSASGGGG